jgi:uncharacterized damage-inducible protein DinB
MKAHFMMMSDYNAWANARLYRMANQLPDQTYRKDVGAYFKSLHGTLNHLLATDRIWMYRLTGAGSHVTRLDTILFDDLPSLTAARRLEDERILHFVRDTTDEQFEELWDYRTMNGTPQRERRREILAHLFNHETHHRGQAHAILTFLGVKEPDSLDLILMQRERKKP